MGLTEEHWAPLFEQNSELMTEVKSLEDLFVTVVVMEAEQVLENCNNLCLQNVGEETP